jgi:hypothetical protein
MKERVDLSPLLVDRDAMHMLLLARGELNRAFRSHGLFPPDPLPAAHLAVTDVAELDDPAAHGLREASARFADLFDRWAAEMPLDLVPPVLKILQKTHETLRLQQQEPSAAARALLAAYEFLLAHDDTWPHLGDRANQ